MEYIYIIYDDHLIHVMMMMYLRKIYDAHLMYVMMMMMNLWNIFAESMMII